jgi:hypothetical protein
VLNNKEKEQNRLCPVCNRPYEQFPVKIHHPDGRVTDATKYVCSWNLMNHYEEVIVHH